MNLEAPYIIFNAAAIAALCIAAALVLRRRQVRKAPPNLSRYYDDDTMEGPRLERVLGWALIFSAVVAASLPVYWLFEPHRQESMAEALHDDSIERGEELFGAGAHGLNCQRCHGAEGVGGAATPILQPETPGGAARRVSWKAPSLDDVLLRFPREQVIEIITYGRAGTPMPAWGVAGGGSKNTQSIEDIVNYLESIQLSTKAARAEQAGETDGQKLFEANCARCHTKGWSYESPGEAAGGGAFAPSLRGGVVQRRFPDVTKHLDFVRKGSFFQKPYGIGGVGSGRMPGFEKILTQEQIEAIVAYERNL